jgi:hypothetical protein
MEKNMNQQSVIAFNPDNSLSEVPDARYVSRVSGAAFPGVAISIRIPLTDDSVRESKVEYED